MQTFLPLESFAATAAVLDQRRLGKQRVEVLQILRALTREDYGWRSHPAVLMWKGYEEALGSYGRAIVGAWTALGFADTTWDSIAAELAEVGISEVRSQDELRRRGALPPWLGDPLLHTSHQAALVRKDPEHYRSRFPEVPEDVPYHWPVRTAEREESESRR